MTQPVKFGLNVDPNTGGLAIAVVGSELVVLAWLRHKFFHTSFARSFLAITVGGAIIATLSAALGVAASG